MPLKIIRNDITKMECDAIVNTANEYPIVGPGVDFAVYSAAGYDELIEARRKIGEVNEGKAFITPAFNLKAKYIIHAVSPIYVDGKSGEERKLRKCYKNSLSLAKKNGMKSIAFPLISTGSYGYPHDEGLRIATEEINSFLQKHDIEVFLVLFDEKSLESGQKLYPDLEEYISENYVDEKTQFEYQGDFSFAAPDIRSVPPYAFPQSRSEYEAPKSSAPFFEKQECTADYYESAPFFMPEGFEDELDERVKHVSDTFSEYLIYLIEKKNKKNVEVYTRAIVDKKVFSKIKNNPNYHPTKNTALRLCIGAELNLDETKDLLARAGYALSPSSLSDVIYSFFIEKGVFDIYEIDIQLENHNLPYLVG